MINDHYKIAVYSGIIPSTTFIERLIYGLSKKGNKIYLFGVLEKKLNYPKSINIICYTHNRFVKLVSLLRYSILLWLFKNKEKNRLDIILSKQSNNNLYSKVKYYPVLWHHPDIFHLQWAKGLAEWIWVQEFGIKFSSLV